MTSEEVLKKLTFEKLDFPEDRYYKVAYEKNQITLHHTASGRGASGDFRYWSNDPKRIATCVIVDYKGVVNQLFSSKYYAYHLGLGNSDFTRFDLPYKNLNKSTIGVEIDAWGQLAKIGGKYYCWTGKEISAERVTTYKDSFGTIPQTSFFEDAGVVGEPCFHYEKYTTAQIEAVKWLLIYWNKIYGIPLCYNSDMWKVSSQALNDEAGIWAHVSYRKYGKSDCHPQPELIEMLQNLEDYV